MRKIANSRELRTELRGILAYAESNNPSRVTIASELNAVTDRLAADVTKADWERALKADEDMLAKYRANLAKIQKGEQVKNLSEQGAKDTIRSLEQVIENKKRLIEKLATTPEHMAGALDHEELLKGLVPRLQAEMEKLIHGTGGKVIDVRVYSAGKANWSVVFDSEYAALRVAWAWRQSNPRLGKSSNLGGWYVSVG